MLGDASDEEAGFKDTRTTDGPHSSVMAPLIVAAVGPGIFHVNNHIVHTIQFRSRNSKILPQ